jgi:ribosomal protein S18 acetylase RimI-like enzyme
VRERGYEVVQVPEQRVQGFLQSHWAADDLRLFGRNLSPAEWRSWRFTLAVKQEGGLAGIITVRGQAGVAHFAELMVAGPMRGRGIGTALLLEAERRSVRRGAHKFTLRVSRSNEDAKRLYRALGWRREAVLRRDRLGEDWEIWGKWPGASGDGVAAQAIGVPARRPARGGAISR